MLNKSTQATDLADLAMQRLATLKARNDAHAQLLNKRTQTSASYEFGTTPGGNQFEDDDYPLQRAPSLRHLKTSGNPLVG